MGKSTNKRISGDAEMSIETGFSGAGQPEPIGEEA